MGAGAPGRASDEPSQARELFHGRGGDGGAQQWAPSKPRALRIARLRRAARGTAFTQRLVTLGCRVRTHGGCAFFGDLGNQRAARRVVRIDAPSTPRLDLVREAGGRASARAAHGEPRRPYQNSVSDCSRNPAIFGTLGTARSRRHSALQEAHVVDPVVERGLFWPQVELEREQRVGVECDSWTKTLLLELSPRDAFFVPLARQIDRLAVTVVAIVAEGPAIFGGRDLGHLGDDVDVAATARPERDTTVRGCVVATARAEVSRQQHAPLAKLAAA